MYTNPQEQVLKGLPAPPALTTVRVPMHACAGQLQAQLVHAPTIATALVTLHLPVIAILITARDEDT